MVWLFTQPCACFTANNIRKACLGDFGCVLKREGGMDLCNYNCVDLCRLDKKCMVTESGECAKKPGRNLEEKVTTLSRAVQSRQTANANLDLPTCITGVNEVTGANPGCLQRCASGCCLCETCGKSACRPAFVCAFYLPQAYVDSVRCKDKIEGSDCV